MRLRRSRLLTTCAAGLLLAACSGGPEETDASDAPPPRDDETAEQDPAAAGEACEQAFADAETAEDGQAALMAAVAACDDIASFTAASAEHPDALGDVEPHVFLAEACDDATEPAVSESPLCDEVAGEQN
ncbi:hypothetical protein [Egicoccus halophilus]|nr:hypothetical protein [Egicoccus halophilus]